jgi:hypothetical protein
MEEVRTMRHLRLANGSNAVTPSAAKDSQESDMCFVDYSHCSASDICWLFDLGCGCANHDNCIIDTG